MIEWLIKFLILLGGTFAFYAVFNLPISEQYFQLALLSVLSLGLGLIAYVIKEKK